jgi:hypothetical protein
MSIGQWLLADAAMFFRVTTASCSALMVWQCARHTGGYGTVKLSLAGGGLLSLILGVSIAAVCASAIVGIWALMSIFGRLTFPNWAWMIWLPLALAGGVVVVALCLADGPVKVPY